MADPNNPEAKKGFIKKIANLLTGRNVPKRESPNTDTLTTQIGRDLRDFFDSVFGPSRERFDMYREYDDMEADSPIVCSALDAVADTAVSGAEGEAEAVFELTFEKENAKISNLFKELDDRCQLRGRAWQTIRSFLKYGDCFQEVVVDQPTKHVAAVEPLPAKSMRTIPRSAMKKKQTEFSFEQWDPENGQKVAEFYPWQVVHFGTKVNPEDLYGRSMLFQARRTYRQLQMIEDSVVINRLSRATMRLVKTVPTPGMTAEAAQRFLDTVKARDMTRLRFDNNGKAILDPSVLSEETDHYVANMGNGVEGKVEVIAAQPGQDRIEDVKYFQRKLFSALRTPPSYLGWEEDTSGTSQIVTVDIAFARLCRRGQLTHGIGMRQIIDTEIALSGTDPSTVEYDLTYAPIATVDEMRRWQVELLKVQVAQLMKATGIVVDNEYLMRNVLEIEEEFVADLLAKAEEEKKKQDKLAQDIAKGQGFGAKNAVPPGAAKMAGGKPSASKNPSLPGGATSKQNRQEQMAAFDRSMQRRGVKIPRHVDRAIRSVMRQESFKRQLEEAYKLTTPLKVTKDEVANAQKEAIKKIGGVPAAV